MLQNATGFESSLDVDRLYSLYNIADEFGLLPDGLPLDYSLEFPDAYAKFVAFMGHTKFGLQLFKIFEDLRDRANDLPSYMTDIRKVRPRLLRINFPRGPASRLETTRAVEFCLHDPETDPVRQLKEELRRMDYPRLQEQAISVQPAPNAILLCATEIGRLGWHVDPDSLWGAHDTRVPGLRFIPYAVPGFTQRPFGAATYSLPPSPDQPNALLAVESLSYTWYTLDSELDQAELDEVEPDGDTCPIEMIEMDRSSSDDERLLGRVVLASTVARQGDILVAAYAAHPLDEVNVVLLRPVSTSNALYRYIGACLCLESISKREQATELNKYRLVGGRTIAERKMPLGFFWIV